MSGEIVRAARVAMAGIQAAVKAGGIEGRQMISVTFYLTVTMCNVPGAVVARAAGCSRQNVAKCLRHVEERREDPAFDKAMEQLERTIGGGYA